MGFPAGDTKEGPLRALTEVLTAEKTPYAIIGGVAIQIYTREPRTTQDIDIALARYEDLPKEALLAAGFRRERAFAYSENWRAPGSAARKQRTAVQFTVDTLTAGTVERAEKHRIRSLRLRVAALPDLVRLKLEAAEEPRRRPSKRQSDVADVLRLIEEHPEVRRQVPDAVDRIRIVLATQAAALAAGRGGSRKPRREAKP